MMENRTAKDHKPKRKGCKFYAYSSFNTSSFT